MRRGRRAKTAHLPPKRMLRGNPTLRQCFSSQVWDRRCEQDDGYVRRVRAPLTVRSCSRCTLGHEFASRLVYIVSIHHTTPDLITCFVATRKLPNTWCLCARVAQFFEGRTSVTPSSADDTDAHSLHRKVAGNGVSLSVQTLTKHLDPTSL